jgi:hypothetical protein
MFKELTQEQANAAKAALNAPIVRTSTQTAEFNIDVAKMLSVSSTNRLLYSN